MPAGTFTVDARATFAVALFMGSGPKLKFGSDTQDINSAGERKWTVQLAVTFFPEYGMAPASDVIPVTMLGGTDPAADLTPGTPVDLDAFKVGISAPEQRERKDGGTRVVGGKPFYSASAIRPAGAGGLRPVKNEQAS